MKTRIAVLVGAGALLAALIVPSHASASPAGPANIGGEVHALLTKQVLQEDQALGLPLGCLLTLSLGCLPIPMGYNGGPVEATGSKNFLIFWEPTGSTVAANYNAILQQFFGDVGGSSLYGIATQYYQKVGSAKQFIANTASVGGVFTDSSAYPSGSLSDGQIQAEVSKAIAANAWPTGVGNEYFVFLAKGENECLSSSSCSFTKFCAYHGNFASGSSSVLYAAMPYAGTNLGGCGIQTGKGTPNGADTDAEISVASHEMMETVTDPLLNAWFDLTGAEIGDKCAFTYGPLAANGSDLTINSHPYIVQEEFSNSGLGCAV